MAAEHDVIEVYPEKDAEDALTGEWRWRRIAANGEIVADSGESYSDSYGGIRAARREADGKAEIRTVTADKPDDEPPAETQAEETA